MIIYSLAIYVKKKELKEMKKLRKSNIYNGQKQLKKYYCPLILCQMILSQQYQINIIMPKLKNQYQQKQRFSFVQSTKKRLLNQFTRIRNKYQLTNIVLVLDLTSAKIISTLFTITQLVEAGIVYLERLQVVRKPLQHHAIYFITPSLKSVDCMLNDFKSESDFQYRKIHVLFTAAFDRNFIKKIQQNKYFLKRLSKHSFKQFYFQLYAISSNCVHLDLNYLSIAFSQQSSQQKQMRVLISKKFIDLVSSYESLNTIKICYQQSPNKVAERIAQKAGQQLKNYLFQLIEAKSPAIRPDASDITIFITDRSVDIVTPLIHGYAYQSLIYDLIGIGNQKEGLNINTLAGTIYQEFRYRHLSHALEELPNRLQALTERLKQKIQAIQLKKIKQQKQKLQIHLQLLHRLWQKFKQKNISEIGQLQLCLATGITSDGKQTSSSELFQSIITIIKNNTSLSLQQIIRLALITLSCIKLSKQDYQRLIGLFKEEDRIILKNLAVFGIMYDKKISKSTKNIDKSTMQKAKSKLTQLCMPSERFTCNLQIIIPGLIDFLKIEKKNKTLKKFMEEIIISVSQEDSTKFDEKRLICFMCGGISQTQICSIRKNSALDQIVIASDCVLSPNQFVEAIRKINILNKLGQ